MGRVKTSQIKRFTHRLMRTHEDKFSSTFSNNKEMVSSLVDYRSKKLRNIIAGYTTRLAKKR